MQQRETDMLDLIEEFAPIVATAAALAAIGYYGMLGLQALYLICPAS